MESGLHKFLVEIPKFFTDDMLHGAYEDWITGRFPTARKIGDVALVKAILDELPVSETNDFAAIREADLDFACGLIAQHAEVA